MPFVRFSLRGTAKYATLRIKKEKKDAIAVRIALCDDERAEVDRLHDLIENYALKKDYQIRIESFTSGTKLLERERFDLYFLDFLMDEMDGLQVAKALNDKFDGAVTVCYLTNYEDAAAQIINGRVYADGFLKKPVDPALLYEKLDQFYSTSFWGRLELRQGRSYRTVFARDIYYIEGDGKSSVAHFADGEETFSHMISELESILSDGKLFFRIHRSYIINMMYVRSYDAKSVTLNNGVTLSLKSKEFQKAYRDFIFRQMP